MQNNKKIILITGASSGIGKVTAMDLIKTGHHVYAAARNVDKMQDLVKAGGHAIKMDISKKSETDAAVEKVLKEQNKIDVLWNNAGFGLYGPVEEIDLDQARYQFEVNLFGLAEITKAILPHMRKQKSGLIINTSSMGGKIYTPLGAWYHATKHALEGWSDCLRLELKEFGIKVVVLEPGAIKTEFGSVVYNNLPVNASNGPYQRIVKAVIKMFNSVKPSEPELISKTVQQIIRAKSPKTRYLVGAMAKPTVFIRNVFGDKIYDKIILSMLK